MVIYTLHTGISPRYILVVHSMYIQYIFMLTESYTTYEPEHNVDNICLIIG